MLARLERASALCCCCCCFLGCWLPGEIDQTIQAAKEKTPKQIGLHKDRKK